ncbi:MAG TPA: DUF669 domain-containing protein [Bryobacteraceae bacterium]|nr:DUF669 domain-containing protein [Bryobacteraceae bacterium]
MGNHSIDLAQFDDDFQNETADERGERDNVPDGKYQVAVERVELTQSSAGNPMLKWTLRILAPRCQNRFLWRNSVFTQNTLKYVKTDLHLCGLDLPKLSDLPHHLGKLLEVKLEVTKKTRGDNENIYFNRRIETAASANRFQREAGDALVRF